MPGDIRIILIQLSLFASIMFFQCCLEIIDLLEKLKNAGHFKFQKIREFRHSLAREKLQWKTEVRDNLSAFDVACIHFNLKQVLLYNFILLCS